MRPVFNTVNDVCGAGSVCVHALLLVYVLYIYCRYLYVKVFAYVGNICLQVQHMFLKSNYVETTSF